MNRLWEILVGIGVALATVLGVYYTGRRDGSAVVAKERLQEDLQRQRAELESVGEAHQVRTEVEKEVRQAKPGANRSELAEQWGSKE